MASTQVWKEPSNVIVAGARAPTVRTDWPSHLLGITDLGVGFHFHPLDLEKNSLKHPLNEGQVSRSVRRLRPPSLFPGQGARSPRLPGKLSGFPELK